MSNRRSKAQKAFTLIELLVVIAIVGILAGLAVVSMSGATEAARIAKLKVYSNSIRSSLMGNRVSEWIFDEGAGTSTVDTVGTNNGTLNNFNFNSASGWRSGSSCVSEGCLQFDGVDDSMSVSNSPSLDPREAMTIAAWYKRTSVYTITSDVHLGSRSPSWFFYDSWNTGQIRGDVFIGGARQFVTTPVVPSNEWHFIVFSYDSSTQYLKMYLDEKEVGSRKLTGLGSYLIDSSSSNMTFNSNSSKSFMIDSVRLYNAALTASAVREQYFAGLDKLLARGQITEKEYQQRLADLNLTYAVNE
jgi:prepilin-type N-terminal cleavage/methylation domain-containing protein